MLEKMTDINYVIATPGHRKKKRVVYTNLLKKFHPCRPDAASALCMISGPEEWGDATASPEMESDFDVGDVGIKSKLSHSFHEQQQDILCDLQQFSDVLRDAP